MTRFRVLVADDEPLARSMVAALLRDDDEIETVLECGDARTAQDRIARTRPDIVFLDIEMPEVTGLDLAKEIAEDGPIVVFVTAFSHYAPQAFEVNASDYVLKPFSDQRFAEALHRAKQRVRERRMGELANQLATLSSELRPGGEHLGQKPEAAYLQRLTFKRDDRTIALKTADVIWIEAEDYYVRVHSHRGRHLIRVSLATLETRLNPRDFLRVHRGAIINVQEVSEVRDAGSLTVVLTNGSEIPVSRSRKPSVEALLIPRLRTS